MCVGDPGGVVVYVWEGVNVAVLLADVVAVGEIVGDNVLV